MKITAKSLLSAVLASILCLNMVSNIAMAAESPVESRISEEATPSVTEELILNSSDPLCHENTIVIPPDSTAENPSTEHSTEENTDIPSNNPAELPLIDATNTPVDNSGAENSPLDVSPENLIIPEVMLMSAGLWDNNPMTATQVKALGIPYYEIDGNHVGIGIEPHPNYTPSGYTGTGSVLDLPSSIDGKRVIEIGDFAFYDPNGAAQCNYTQVNFPQSLIKIGDSAFIGSKLTSVYLPDGLQELGYGCFASSHNLTKVRIPGSITTCSKNVGNSGPFEYCDKLTSAGPLGSGCDIEFGWSEEIPNSAFNGVSSLTSVILPDGLRKIGSQAFEFCNLPSIKFPETLESIGYNAFRCNRNLRGDLVFPECFSHIENHAFERCAITSARFKGVIKIERYTMPFFQCNNMQAVHLDSCLSTKEDWWGQQENDGAHPIRIPVIWSHELTSDWTPWAKSSGARDENGNSLWNGNYRHYRTASCAECGLAYEFERCKFIFPETWTSNGNQNHIKKGVCTVCGETNYEFEDHDGLGPWVYKDSHSHSRSVNCSICGYVGEQKEKHNYKFGDWSDYDEQSHVHTGICTSCGYETQERYTHFDNDNNGFCDVCNHEMSRFSVTLPANLSLVMSEIGQIHAAQTASIVNNSTGTVAVTGMKFQAENGWKIVPYATDMADEKVDSKEIGFCINSAKSTESGNLSILNTAGPDWFIPMGATMPINYDAVVSASTQPINEQVLTVIFILDWAA